MKSTTINVSIYLQLFTLNCYHKSINVKYIINKIVLSVQIIFNILNFPEDNVIQNQSFVQNLQKMPSKYKKCPENSKNLKIQKS